MQSELWKQTEIRRRTILQKPRPLRPGDRVAVIATSSPFERENLERGLATLRAQGFDPVLGSHAFDRHRYLAGGDAERASDFVAAVTDPSIRGIICARGGYGAARMLSHIDANVVRPHCKAFVGFSDVTALHLWLLETCGWVTFHGPMVATKWAGEGLDGDTLRSLVDAVSGNASPVSSSSARVLHGGRARGRLIGGNLSILCHSIGTSFEPDTRDCLLFIEDVHEAPYRIDRMLTHLRQAGKLTGVRGVIVGEMLECDAPTGADFTVDDVVDSSLEDLQVPIVTRFPISHGKPNHTVALGIEYEMDADGCRLTPLEPPTVAGPTKCLELPSAPS